MERRPVLIVIAGPNGSGKTTVTNSLLRHSWTEDTLYINPDQIAKDKFGDWNDKDAIMQAATFCQRLREESLEKRQSL